MKPQALTVLEWLRRGDRITVLTAMHRGVGQLLARVHEIRREGYPVKREWRKTASGNRYAEFSL